MISPTFFDGPKLITVSEGGQPLAILYQSGACTYRVEFVNGWPTTYLYGECRACVKAAFRSMWLAWQFCSPSLQDGAS